MVLDHSYGSLGKDLDAFYPDSLSPLSLSLPLFLCLRARARPLVPQNAEDRGMRSSRYTIMDVREPNVTRIIWSPGVCASVPRSASLPRNNNDILSNDDDDDDDGAARRDHARRVIDTASTAAPRSIDPFVANRARTFLAGSAFFGLSSLVTHAVVN